MRFWKTKVKGGQRKCHHILTLILKKNDEDFIGDTHEGSTNYAANTPSNVILNRKYTYSDDNFNFRIF